MKKLLFMVMAFLAIQTMSAQERRMNKMADYTPEEQAEIQTKKMTLALDLTEAQQKKVQAIHLENAKNRKVRMEEFQKMRGSGEKPTKEQRLARENERLDRQIEIKKQMKSILNEDQYTKWETQMEQRRNRMADRGQKMSGNKKMQKRRP
ncbi:hypothetical protein LRR18_13205 [Mangrovimonas sp. AS39]|uniref:hypothetical protein n=1 Tax=Mangrovimonas TaxID=1211036 RepID=UPI0006B47A6B|nr:MULTISPECIES: hypothetical protein [Mangrovimonas]MCF1192547.1 hypothetical protein [Mangrovimonas futianensis]MCF1196123.1 hypothetical protein [Mangrovimonas futianensis]MCF1422508.1 hypothetical protein [Mangrovimonas futianensis]NIK93146.1 hypothetical protein [Mangrovimonas sp. CR14]